MPKLRVVLTLIAGCCLFLAHAVIPHEHEGGHVASVISSKTHQYHNHDTTTHDHESDCDHSNELEDFCLLENVIPSRTTSLTAPLYENDNAHADLQAKFFPVSIFKIFIEPPEKIPDKPGITDNKILHSNPNLVSSGLRAPPCFC